MPKFSYFSSIRRLVLACLLGGLGLAALGQTCAIPGWDGPATPSGVINSYHGGSGSPAAGVSSITVASIAGQRTNTRSLRVGDLILIMQMQDSATGANAGLHEYAMITAISGATLTLNRALTNSYNQLMDTSNVRNWQVVWVPQYSSATLSGTVSADRWTSNTGTGVGTGGIVAMDVAGSLALSGTVTVAGAGFRGAFGLNGTGNLAAGTPTTANSVYVPGTPYGGQKGEGIQGTPPRVFNGTVTPVNYTALLGQGYALGAGGQAAIGNAGGGANDGAPPTGGNQYNSGGGGGSNAGAGGRGGNTWNAGGTSGALNDPAGSNVGNPGGGLGGNAQTNSANRLMLGGGGGAGSSNNNSDPNAITTWPPTVNGTTRPPAGVGTANGAEGPISVSGAPGGGVVLIRAGSIPGSGRIVANGYTAFNTEGGSEGAGGGGAGGSVFVSAGAGGTNLTISANGGGGGYSNYYNHGPGGGGGGGYIVTNFTPATTSVTAGTNGLDGCCGGVAGNGSPKAYNATAGSPGTVLTSGGTPVGVVGGAGCLPAITVSKSTSTPTITSATGATATYRINLANTGGAASNVFIFDANLPPGWAYTSSPASTYTYAPAPPGAASAGAETTSATIPAGLPVSSATSVNSATAVSLRASGAAPGVVPTTGNNSATFGSFYLPQNGSITLTFAATIPDTATAGTYHNPAGVIFLDPTRLSGGETRMVSPLANVNANRAATGYSANTTYASGATTNVAGTSYSGLEGGPAAENVTLLPNLRVVKSTPTSTATSGITLNYVIGVQNIGRPVSDQVYATTQATGQSATAMASSPLRLTDTLPSGFTATAVVSTPPAWVCSGVGSGTVTCAANSPTVAAIYPIALGTLAAPTSVGTVTVTVSPRADNCASNSVTNTATLVTSAIGETSVSDNTATAATGYRCGVNLSVSKTNNTSTLASGQTTSYTVTIANGGPSEAGGSVLLDTPSAGLSSCTVTACTPSGGALCPGTLANMLSPGPGLGIATWPSGGALVFNVQCTVTATGLP